MQTVKVHAYLKYKMANNWDDNIRPIGSVILIPETQQIGESSCYVKCDGAIYSKVEYAELYEVIGDKYSYELMPTKWYHKAFKIKPTRRRLCDKDHFCAPSMRNV